MGTSHQCDARFDYPVSQGATITPTASGDKRRLDHIGRAARQAGEFLVGPAREDAYSAPPKGTL
jgi:hypothetical protein